MSASHERRAEYLARPGDLAFLDVVAGLTACLLAVAPRSLLWLERFTVPKQAVLHAAALSSALVLVARARRLRVDRLDVAVGLFGMLGWISSHVVAINPRYSGQAAALSVSGALLFWSARSLSDCGYRRALLYAAALALGCFAFGVLLEAYGVLPGLSPRAPGGTVGNRNRAAHLMVFALPVLWAGIGWARHRALSGALLLCTAAAGAVIVLSRTRGAWLAAVVLLGYAATVAQSPRVRTRVGRRSAAFAAAVGLGAALALFLPNALRWDAGSTYLSTARRITNYRSGTGRDRLIQDATNVRMARAHPILGVGPGNWMVEYPRYASPADPWLNRTGAFPTEPNPQQDWTGLAAERGPFALVLLAYVAGALGVSAWSRVRSGDDDDDDVVAALALGGVGVAVTLLGTVDAFLLLTAPTYACAVVVGALAPSRARAPAVALHPRRKVASLVAVVLPALPPLRQSVRRIRAALAIGSWSDYDADPAPLTDALQVDPDSHVTHVLLALHWARARRCDRARAHIETAGALFPTAPTIAELRQLCAARGRHLDTGVPWDDRAR